MSTLPAGWTSLPITDIASFGSGDGISVARLAPRSGRNPIPVFGGNGVAGYTSTATVTEPTVILGRVGQKCGVVYMNAGPAWITDNALYARRFKRPVDVRFLALALEGARLNDLRNKNDLPLITQAILNDVELAWPENEAEQTHIADVLEATDSVVDALEKLIVKKEWLRRGLLQHLLTGARRLPDFAEPWKSVCLGDHVNYVRTAALSRAQLDTTSTLRYLHYGDIHTSESVRLDSAREPLPRASIGLAGRAGRLVPGDLVFADASEDPAGVGRSVEISTVPVDGVVAGLHTIAARFDQQVLANGFKAYLQFIPEFRNSLLRLAAGTKVLATTRNYISSITLDLPSLPEQIAITKVLLDADAELASLKRRLDKTRKIKVGMMQVLLTGQSRLPSKESA